MRRYLPCLVALVLAACSGSSISSPSPVAPSVPPLGLNVTIDNRVSAVAIRGASEVVAEVIGDAVPTSHEIDFGDGTPPVSDLRATHVYQSSGRFAIKLRAGAGPALLVTKDVTVSSVEGPWSNSVLNPSVGFVEVRRLTITSQSGKDLSGTYFSSSAQADRSFTGQLLADRAMRLSLDDGTVDFSGVVPDGVRDRDATMQVAVRGGSAGGQTLAFTPFEYGQLGLPPVARLTIRYDSFNTPFAFTNLSPVRFDASGSTGDGLSCLIEFGDGSSSHDCSATHPLVLPSFSNLATLSARLTVTDRFGRSGIVTTPVYVFGLVNTLASSWANSDFRRAFEVVRQDGRSLAGYWWHVVSNSQIDRGAFTGLLSGEREISLTLDNGVNYSGWLGTKWLPGQCCGLGYFDPFMMLQSQNGPDAGKTFKFGYYEVY